MKPFTFTLRQEPPQRVDLSALTPDRLAGKSAAQIEQIEIGTTRASTKVGDLFKIAEGDLKNVRYEGGSSRFDLIGAKLLPDFAIHVEGDVGAQLGRLAKGGRITVCGSAGPFAASGNLGRTYRDQAATWAIFSRGRSRASLPAWRAGAWSCAAGPARAPAIGCGAAFSIVEGDAGEDVGSRVIAGTIFVLGQSQGRIGYLNKRGSIVLSRGDCFGPTYVDCGAHDLTFARLFARSLKSDSPRGGGSPVTQAPPLWRRHGGLWQGRDIDPRLTGITLALD